MLRFVILKCQRISKLEEKRRKNLDTSNDNFNSLKRINNQMSQALSTNPPNFSSSTSSSSSSSTSFSKSLNATNNKYLKSPKFLSKICPTN